MDDECRAHPRINKETEKLVEMSRKLELLIIPFTTARTVSTMLLLYSII